MTRTVLVFALLFVRIAIGPSEGVTSSSTSLTCPFLHRDCSGNEECFQVVCFHVLGICRNCESTLFRCLTTYPNCAAKPYEGRKRRSVNNNSFLFMKLHPLLNRGSSDSTRTNVPNRYRRIGVRIGSELLGKRSDRGFPEGEEGLQRGRRLLGTELLGKRWGSEMLGKRNVELLGKRGVEFLGKRVDEGLPLPCGGRLDEEDEALDCEETANEAVIA